MIPIKNTYTLKKEHSINPLILVAKNTNKNFFNILRGGGDVLFNFSIKSEEKMA